MKRFYRRSGTILGVFTLVLLFVAAPQVRAQVRGWCEEKYLIRDRTTVVESISMPSVIVEGDDVFVVYRQGNIKFISSQDRGKTWSKAVDIAPDLRVCSAPSIAKADSKLVIVWPALVQVGQFTAFQLFFVESSDGGKSWSEAKRITQSQNDTFSPRMLMVEDQVMLAWLETPLAETLGNIPMGQRPNYSPESVESLYETRVEDKLVDRRKQVHSTFYASFFNPRVSSFSNQTQIHEIFAQRIPHIFAVYGPYNGNLYLTVNQNAEIRTYESTDKGRSWDPYFQDQRFFNAGMLIDALVVDGKLHGVWIPRQTYQQIPINYRVEGQAGEVQLSPPHYVRSLPRISHSDEVFHVVWSAGQGEESWLTYMRTDEIPPTSEIVQPKSPDIIERSVTFRWQGEDNISATDRLTYSYSYGDQPWSVVQPETSATIKTPPDGEYHFKVRAQDVAGNIQNPVTSFEFNTFKSAPNTQITNAPPENQELNTRSVEIEFTGEDNTDPASKLMYSVQVDDQPWSDFYSGLTHTFSNLSNGTHTLRVKMRDSIGNVDPTPAECQVSIQVDLELVLSATPSLNTNADVMTFGWKATDDQGQPVDLQYSYRLDGGDVAELQNAERVELPQLEEGRHEFTVWGTDASGDQTPQVTYKWVVDRTPPETDAAFTKEYAGDKYPLISLQANDPPLPGGERTVTPNQFEYRIGDGEWISFTHSGTTWPVERALSFYSWGYIVALRAIDAAGNVDPSPDTVDLRIFVRTNPYIFYPVVVILALVILYLLRLVMPKGRGSRRRSAPSSSMATSSTLEGEETPKESAMDDTFGETSSFDFDKEEDSDKNDPYA